MEKRLRGGMYGGSVNSKFEINLGDIIGSIIGRSDDLDIMLTTIQEAEIYYSHILEKEKIKKIERDEFKRKYLICKNIGSILDDMITSSKGPKS